MGLSLLCTGRKAAEGWPETATRGRLSAAPAV